MRLVGNYYKDGKFWLCELPFIQLMDQGRTKKECLIMIKDAIEILINDKEFKCEVTELGNGKFAVGTSQVKTLAAFVVRRLREAQGLTIREAGTLLGMKSHTEYARHESGKVAMNMETFNRYVEVLSSKEITLQIA